MMISGIARYSMLTSILLMMSLTFAQAQAQEKTFQFDGKIAREASKALLPGYTINSQTADELNITYDFKTFTIHDINGQKEEKYKLLRIKGFGLSTKVGAPALPVKNEKIVIPEGKEVKIRVIAEDFIEYTGIDIYPAQEMGLDGSQSIPDFSKDEKAYQENDFYPVNLAELRGEQVFRGVRLGNLRINPVQYNPVTRTLRIYRQLEINIEFVETDKKYHSNYTARNNSDFRILSNSVLNTSILPVKTHKDKSAFDLQSKGYLIITVPEFEDAADSLAKWKRQLGYHVEVYSQAYWTVSQVKSLTTNIYTNSSYDFEYLLLFGDHDHIPDYYYADDINGEPWEIYSTNYYACMDAGDDFVPEMAHGRISVRNAAQAIAVVNKVINYEKAPPTDPDFYRKGIHAGYFQDSTRDGNSDYRYARTTIEMYEYMSSLDFQSDLILYAESDVTPISFNPYFSGVTTVPEQYRKSSGFAWDGSKDDIIGAWNEGRLYAFHRDHGLKDQWMAPYFHVSHMDDLENGDKLPIVFSVNCGTGDFVEPEPFVCFSEKLQRHPNGGAIGIVSATAQTKSGFNDGLIIGMMDAIWADPGIIPDMGLGADDQIPSAHGPIYTMGDVMIQGLIRMTETWSTSGWADKNQFHLYHYFGDPAMQVWTELPVQLSASHNASIEIGANSLYIHSVNAQDAIATICIDGQLLKKVRINNGSGTIILPQPITESMSKIILTISKHNYIPYISELKVSMAPVAAFSADPDTVCPAEIVSFTDLSVSEPESWIWEIEPATYEFVNSTYESRHPEIRFLNSGLYTISLTVTNSYGNNTLTKDDFISVKPVPDVPLVSDVSRCDYEDIPTLVAVGSAVRWYEDENLSILLYEGNEYTPGDAPAGETTFYLNQNLDDCVSASVSATITSFPETPFAEVFNSAICENETAYFIASGNQLRWYSDSSGTEYLATGDTLMRFSLEVGEYILYASNTENGCESALVPGSVNIKSQPDIPYAEDVELCFGDVMVLEAEGEHIYWYAEDNPQLPLYFGNIFEAGTIAAGDYKFYITQEIDDCISEAGEVNARVNSLPIFSLGNDTSIFNSDTLVLNCTDDGSYIWFDGSMSNSVLFIGSDYGEGRYTCWLELRSPENCYYSDSIDIVIERDAFDVNNYHFTGHVFTAFPNPSSDIVRLKFFQTIDISTRLIITDTQGNVVLLQEMEKIEHDSNVELDLSILSDGLYLLTIQNEAIVHTLRILKE